MLTDACGTITIEKNLYLPLLPLSDPFHGREETDMNEECELGHNEPDIHHLDVGGGGQLLHDRDEDGGEHQHVG